MNKNDNTIMQLKEQIAQKKKSIGKIKRFSPLTSCSLDLDGTRYNLHVASRETLIYILCKMHLLNDMSKNLGYPNQCVISGFSTESWICDIADRLAIISQKEKIEQLAKMEEKLNQLLTVDTKTELQISEIAKMLDIKE